MMVEARALANDIETEPAPAPLDLRRYLRPGDTVIWGQSCAEARSLTLALADQQPAIGPLRCFIGSSIAPLPALDPVAVTFVSYGGGGANRLLDWAGALEILPSCYSALPGLFADRSMPIDVAFVQVTPGEEAGTFHFSLAAEYLVAAARSARVIIAEVNAGAPHTPDAPILRASEITALVTASYRPLEAPTSRAMDCDRRIAAHVARLVEGGSTLQLGLGSLPDTVARSLGDRTDLGVHSGAIGDAVALLTRSGAITIPRSDAGIVVTEYGAVDLRGLTPSQRRERLFSIAHPDHRGRLDAISPGPGQIRVVDREQPA